ncbi:MAG: RNA-binding protein [Patescibacteria group bacterium]|nr:RNA-binding protein [Patescibacteria group bacterium]
MAKKLYVGGLPYSVSESQLNSLFSQAGTVSSAIIISDKYSGQSKGFGFVEFQNDAEADKAIEMFNGKDFEGRKIVVNEARPMEERRPGGFSGGRDRRPGGFDNRGRSDFRRGGRR